MPKTPRFWIAIAATLTLGGGIALPDAGAQTKFTVGNAGGSSADAERKVFYGPFANANKIQIQEGPQPERPRSVPGRDGQPDLGNRTPPPPSTWRRAARKACSRRWTGPSTRPSRSARWAAQRVRRALSLRSGGWRTTAPDQGRPQDRLISGTDQVAGKRGRFTGRADLRDRPHGRGVPPAKR